MARAETLEILGGIVDQLKPVGEVQRGMPLLAADWNTIVEAVSDLAKLVAERERSTGEQLDQRFATVDHGHEGEAALTWFEPQTRKLLEAAASGSVDQRIGQKKTERELAALRGDLGELRKEMEQLRIAIDGLRDSDHARARSLGQIGNDVETLKDLEGGLDNLAERITGIGDDIATVLTFRDELTRPNGETIDVAQLADQVSDLSAMRENLLTADGELVRIRELESAIGRLEEGSITRADADGLIADRVRDADFFSDAGLLDDVSRQVGESLDPRLAAIDATANDLRADIDSLEAEVAPIANRMDAVDARLAAQDGRLDALDTLGPRIDQVSTRVGTLEGGLQDARTAIAALPALSDSVTALGIQVEGLQGLSTQVNANAAAIDGLGDQTAALEAATAGLPALSDRTAALESETSRIGALDSRVAGAEARVNEFETRIAVNEAQLDTLESVPARLAGLDSSTANLATWRQSAESRLTQLSAGANDKILIERLDTLEERVADQNIRLTRVGESLDQLRGREPAISDLESRLRSLEQGAGPGGGVLRPTGPGGRPR